MLPDNFTLLEGAKLVGALYETVTPVMGVQAGTRGRVVDFLFLEPHMLMIEWDSQAIPEMYRTMPLTKTQVNRHLRLVESAPAETTAYTEPEACALVGNEFENIVNFSLIPKGTHGNIIDCAKRKDGSAVVIVQWTLTQRSKPLTSWFTKVEVARLGRIV